jgi:uncharacterized glyoxalase superfamily protein PhnB
MTIATRYTFWGSCREAISFYCRVFGFEIVKMQSYGDYDDLWIPVNPEHKDLIHSAVLLHSNGCRLYMCDSITLLLSHDPIGEINKGHLSEKGCREGSAFEVCNLTEEEITAIYKQLVENQSIVHFQLVAKDNLKLYASVMDKYNLCWNLSCEQ